MKNLKSILSEVKKTLWEDSFAGSTAKTPAEFIKDLEDDPYETFFKKLKASEHNQSLISYLRGLAKNRLSGLKLRRTVLETSQMHPTQNEVDLTKSLFFPLTHPEDVERYLGDTKPVIIGGSPVIVSLGSGKKIAIVDGHHRWSQLFCVNPKSKMVVHAIEGVEDPTDALKATQIGILASSDEGIKISTAEGKNLFTISESDFKKYVLSVIKPEVVKVFSKYHKGDSAEGVANYLWGNVKQLQSNNKPIFGSKESKAPSRSLMPQTDAEGAKGKWVKYGINPEK